MNVPTGKKVQPIAVGIDPGSKWEGYTVKSEAHTYLNIQADAVTWVKKSMFLRKKMRSSRRHRKTPYRKDRQNRKRSALAPSTKARWQWKLRIASWLCKLFPVDCFVVEDVKAKMKKGCTKWNTLFSPLQIGKTWFYAELGKLAGVETLQGYETFALREQYGLKKGSNKSKKSFSSHCVDSWVLANYYVGGHTTPDNKNLLLIIPMRFFRRQLHVLQPAKGGYRKRQGGTRSFGFKKGSIIRHPTYGKVFIGGTQRDRLSLHSLEDGKRLCKNAHVEACTFVSFNSWKMSNSQAEEGRLK
jgi:hypothetical protein